MSRLGIRWSFVHLLLLQMSVLQIFPVAVTSKGTTDYCKISPQHTMCATPVIGPACGGAVNSHGVSDVEAATITSAHNKLRAKVAQGLETRGAPGPQPQAADMREFTWDEELAAIAQRHADQCVFKHDCNECRSVGRFAVGQNICTVIQSNNDKNVNWDAAVMAWYDEVDKVPASAAARFSGIKGTGHYTQVVWGSTYKVGCGYTMYKEGIKYKKLYTCNYGPAGNYLDTPIYQSGKPCSKCPGGTSCSTKHPGLCGTSARIEKDRSAGGSSSADATAAAK